MKLVIELLHQYTRLLDISGESKNQKIYLSEEGAKEFNNILLKKYPNKNEDILDIDGYHFEIIKR